MDILRRTLCAEETSTQVECFPYLEAQLQPPIISQSGEAVKLQTLSGIGKNMLGDKKMASKFKPGD